MSKSFKKYSRVELEKMALAEEEQKKKITDGSFGKKALPTEVDLGLGKCRNLATSFDEPNLFVR